jgi:hypothetical protein
MLSRTATVLAVAALAAGAPDAPARTLPTTPLAGVAAWVGAGDARSIVYADAQGRAVVQRDGAASSVVATPDGCRLAAAGGGRLLYTCGVEAQADQSGPPLQRLTSTALDGADPRSVRTDLIAGAEGLSIDYTHVGSRWAAAEIGGKEPATLFVDLRSAALRRLDDLRLRTDAVDLSAAGPYRRRCPVLRRRAARFPYAAGDGAWTGRDRPPWGIVWRDGSAAEVWHCAAHRPRAVLHGQSDLRVALGAGWVAWMPSPQAHAVHLLRLRDGRRLEVPAAFGHTYDLVFTADRLYLAGDQGNRAVAAYARLPAP